MGARVGSVVIDALVLHGVRPGDVTVATAAFEKELARLVRETSFAVGITDLGRIEPIIEPAIRPGAGAEEIGIHAARAVARELLS